ncbi:MAG TPA: QacE family quaternary ammonium compound efflux SMR transporter [Chlorobaculum sp.]|jgi:small multidrug resistance pump|uniref:SMR drug efflux transporter n=1 Tax=Chlorobaculum tepidum (strain ATCC 49652 / DSM 12025 / NBRC 103806 / TLS) TaxID=194439 RepID=Q8KCG5_CHLTE|nr:multidrug efflux SMR transporter [Chlorobaculum tepidum]AAM72684.1 SMR drug efflux transporter [Chlorobaculum tepidum TLS]HBU22654.1 QacE family quaternary ammonium compound efflux SMR transporter [Chlorobaculum sp.]
MPWLYLILAIIAEVSGTTSMKLSAGFTKPVPSVFIFVFYATSLTFLTLALRTLPVGMSYAIWSALGTALITAIGVLWFGEGLNALKIISLILIIAGIAGLHFSQEHMK